MSGRAAITIDGTDTPIRGAVVTFPATTVARPRRHLPGLLIGIATAAVALGATGPRPTPAADEEVRPNPVTLPADAAPDRPTAVTPLDAPASSVAWWRRPRLRVWVDPATGLTHQAEPAASTPSGALPWWSRPQMRLWIDPATAMALEAEARDHDRLSDDPHRDR